MSLTLPAIQSARESGRRTQCRNNVRNIAQACNSHLEAQKCYPSGGWGWGWAGDPDRGFGMRQCGGWMYSILPYIEETALHSKGKGQSDAVKRQIGSQRVGTPIPLLNCPTRRRPDQLPYIHGSPYFNIDRPSVIARSDYAGNGGDDGFADTTKGPGTAPNPLPAVRLSTPLARRTATARASSRPSANGTRPTSRMDSPKPTWSASVTCTSRRMKPAVHDDDQGWDVGYDWDTVRWTNREPKFDEQVENITGGNENFGSIHLGSFHMAMCDGSVKSVTYEIDLDHSPPSRQP